MKRRALATVCVLTWTGCAASVDTSQQAAKSPPLPPNLLATAWYLPPHFGKTRDAISFAGTGASVGKLYAHSPDLPVVGGALYEARATIDARYVRGEGACFYLAQIPSGADLGIECAKPGSIGTYAVRAFVPDDVAAVQFVAFADDLVVDRGRQAIYSHLAIEKVSVRSADHDLLEE